MFHVWNSGTLGSCKPTQAKKQWVSLTAGLAERQGNMIAKVGEGQGTSMEVVECNMVDGGVEVDRADGLIGMETQELTGESGLDGLEDGQENESGDEMDAVDAVSTEDQFQLFVS